MAEKKGQSKKVPHRQIGLRRDHDRGCTKLVVNVPDSSALKVGADFFAKLNADPNEPWKIEWMGSTTTTPDS